jgi:hypothetical protein
MSKRLNHEKSLKESKHRHDHMLVWYWIQLCNQACMSQVKLWVWSCKCQGVLDTTICEKVCHQLAASPVSSTSRTSRHNIITEIVSKVVNTQNPNHWGKEDKSML